MMLQEQRTNSTQALVSDSNKTWEQLQVVQNEYQILCELYHKNMWTPGVDEELNCRKEVGNILDLYAIAIVTLLATCHDDWTSATCT